ncbi:unnamed protein product, partial [Closterium sp. NIES-54]
SSFGGRSGNEPSLSEDGEVAPATLPDPRSGESQQKQQHQQHQQDHQQQHPHQHPLLGLLPFLRPFLPLVLRAWLCTAVALTSLLLFIPRFGALTTLLAQ